MESGWRWRRREGPKSGERIDGIESGRMRGRCPGAEGRVGGMESGWRWRRREMYFLK